MIDKYSGKVAYAVMSFGGFLGMGKHLVAIPVKQFAHFAPKAVLHVHLHEAVLLGEDGVARVEGPTGPLP